MIDRRRPAIVAGAWLLALLVASPALATDAGGTRRASAGAGSGESAESVESAGPGGAIACAQLPGRATVRAKRVGASWEVAVRDGGWRRLTRLAKQPLGLQRSRDGAYVAYVDRDFRPDGVLVIQRLSDGGTFTGELNALPRDLCFSADGATLLMESRGGEWAPFPLSAVPAAER